jgi:hypothetical protein
MCFPFLQDASARLEIARKNLPELCNDRMPCTELVQDY